MPRQIRQRSVVSIYEVARRAGVSIVTVSRVFNDYPHVSGRMRERVLAAARRVGYSPRVVSRPRVIAVIVGHLEFLHAGDYKSALMMHLLEAAARRRYLLEFVPVPGLDLVTQRHVDGVIELGLTSVEMEGLGHLPDVPAVLINKRIKGQKSWSTVCSNHYQETQLAARHLWPRGHRRLALVLDEREGWAAEMRRKGLEDFARATARGKLALLVLSSAQESPSALAREIRSFRASACINLTDNYGFALLGALTNELGLRIPRDLSVIALEDETISPHLQPPLTTIAQPLRDIAEAAMQGLMDRIEEGAGVFHKSLNSRLIERRSVRPIAGGRKIPAKKG